MPGQFIGRRRLLSGIWDPSTAPAPGARRLLKGGTSSGGGWGSSSSGSSSSGVGSRSGTSRSPRASSGSSRSPTYRSSGYYSSGGRSYYAGGRAYGYHHGLNAYMPGIAVSVRDASTKELDTNYDRFELTSESYIDVPDAGGNWPLTLTVHNATLFSPDTATRGGEAVFVAMYTTSGDECVATPSTVPGPPGSCPQPTSRTTLWSVPRLWTQPPARSPLHLPRARYAKISEALLWSGYAVLIVVCAGFFCLFCFALCCD